MKRFAVLLTLILVLPIRSHADEATAKALQEWYRGAGPLPDLIARQDGLNRQIGPPLSEKELQTLREALWKRETDNLLRWPDRLAGPTIFQQMAFAHLLKGGALRAGDFTALHGALLSALQPNSYALARKWERVMDCIGHNAVPECVGF